MYIYICIYTYANLHPRCRIAFYTQHPTNSSQPSHVPRQTRSRLARPSLAHHAPIPLAPAPSPTPHRISIQIATAAASSGSAAAPWERRPRRQRATWPGRAPGGVARRLLCGPRKLRRHRAVGRLGCVGIEQLGAGAAAARKQRGMEAAAASSGTEQRRLIGIIKRPACRGYRDA